MQKSTLCPEAIKKLPNLSTGVAFDFHRYVETKSGKDTLHDTVGIIYQNIDPNILVEPEIENLPSVSGQETSDSRKRKRRTFGEINIEEQPYPKQPKMIDNLEISIHENENALPANLQLYNNIDTIWMLSHALQIPNLPMWVGYNCLISKDNNARQLVSYLTPINSSPTNTPVVLETMKQSHEAMKKLNNLPSK